MAVSSVVNYTYRVFYLSLISHCSLLAGVFTVTDCAVGCVSSALRCLRLFRLSLPSGQNIHLVAKWLGTLEKKLEQHGESSHPELRVFISAESSATPAGHIIPQGILENSIKITNEPPMGMHANLHKALDNFNQVRDSSSMTPSDSYVCVQDLPSLWR